MALPHGAVGSSAVCDFVISWSYSLIFCVRSFFCFAGLHNECFLQLSSLVEEFFLYRLLKFKSLLLLTILSDVL